MASTVRRGGGFRRRLRGTGHNARISCSHSSWPGGVDRSWSADGSDHDRYFSVDFDRTDHAKVAEAYGLKAWRVEDPLKLRAALAAAVAHAGPTLVDIVAQPLQEARAPVSEWVA